MNGVINIRKEKGCTSHDVVAAARRILKQRKIGHTGTLDPLAEGVLPICIGKATRLADYIMGGVKGYRANITFGITTDTQDAGGVVLEQRTVTVTREEIEACILSFIGEYDQLPPMYSAVKVNGQRLYKLAREGEVVSRAPRKVEIFEISVREFISDAEAVIDVVCGKGTYIRALCYDIGEKLGCGAFMSALLRTRSGDFELETAVTLDELQKLAEQNRVDEVLISPSRVLARYSSVKVQSSAEKLLLNGNKIRLDQIIGDIPADGECVLVYGDSTVVDEPIALYKVTGDVIKCEIML